MALQLVPFVPWQSLRAPAGSIRPSAVPVLPVSVCSGITGIPQNRVYTIAREFAPLQISRPGPLPCAHRKSPLLVPELVHHTQYRTGPPKRAKHLPDALLHLLVRIQNYMPVGIVEETCRQRNRELSPPHFVQDSTAHARPQNVEFGFAHGALQP